MRKKEVGDECLGKLDESQGNGDACWTRKRKIQRIEGKGKVNHLRLVLVQYPQQPVKKHHSSTSHFLWPDCVYLAMEKAEVPHCLRGSYLLASLLIGTCPLSAWWVAEPQSSSAAEQLRWTSLLQKEAELHFWAWEIFVRFICRKATNNPFTWKEMKAVHLEKASRDQNKETAGERLFKNPVCWFPKLKRRVKQCTEPREGTWATVSDCCPLACALPGSGESSSP